jgi:hypothetical protein
LLVPNFTALHINYAGYMSCYLEGDCCRYFLEDGPLLAVTQPGVPCVAIRLPASPPFDVVTRGQLEVEAESRGDARPEGVAGDGVGGGRADISEQ